MNTDRRALLGGMMTAGALAPMFALERAMAQVSPEAQAAAAHDALMRVPGLRMHGSEEVAMLLYPGFTALDLVGPHYFFASMMGAKVHLVTNQRTLKPVESDLGLAIQPTITMKRCPRDLTVLFLPGGSHGTVTAASDPETLAFVQDRGPRAKTVSSVCTGSVILGVAGLLKGRRATSHWVVRDRLARFGATPVNERIVVDGPVVTAAGVSAGLDFGLAMVERLRGRPYAQSVMLMAEYQPHPPFPGGTPETTDPAIVGPTRDMFAEFFAQVDAFKTP